MLGGAIVDYPLKPQTSPLGFVEHIAVIIAPTLPLKRKTMETIQSDDFIFEDNNKAARAYVCFCDKELLISVAGGGCQYDFHFTPDMLKIMAYAYQLHCKDCENKKEL